MKKFISICRLVWTASGILASVMLALMVAAKDMSESVLIMLFVLFVTFVVLACFIHFIIDIAQNQIDRKEASNQRKETDIELPEVEVRRSFYNVVLERRADERRNKSQSIRA